MTPVTFPEVNRHIGKPVDWDESQCGGIDVHCGYIQGGNLDGCPAMVTAWKPTAEELAAINAGAAIFLTWCTVALAPHKVSVDFETAMRS